MKNLEKNKVDSRRSLRGLSMLETMLAILLMTLTLWSIQVLYVNLLAGTKTSDARRAAVAEAESVLAQWKLRARDLWPEGQGTIPTEEAFSVEGSHQEYLYRVELSGRLPNPLRGSASETEKPEVLEMQTVTVTLFYTEDGESNSNRPFVKLVGSISN